MTCRRIEAPCSPGVTPSAAAILGIHPAQGHGPLLCSADELDALSETDRSRTVIAVYSDKPKQAYACRKAAYDCADACLTLSPETAARLELLHPTVLQACSGEQALALATAFDPDSLLPQDPRQDSETRQSPMTILFVTHDFRVGGLEQVVIDIAVLAKTWGHRPIIGYAGVIDDITRKDVEKVGIEHMRLPESFEDRKSFLREQTISIVNAHYATILAEECAALGIPFLQTIHNMYLWLGEAGIAQWRELDSLTSGYIAVSANAAMVADLRLGLPPEKMVIVPNGVAMIDRRPSCPPEQDEALRSELDIPPDGVVFVQVASLSGVKGHAVAVEAFARALETRGDVYLVLLGKEADPAVANPLREKIERYNLGKHVLMPGYRKDVHRFLNLARAMLAPSFVEGWSLAINEALQFGTPVIATDVGGACEQFRGTDNILLPSYFTDVATMSASAFFAAMNDERVIAEGACRLAEAVLDMAKRPARRHFVTADHRCRLPEEAYATHLEAMLRLLNRDSLAPVRASAYIPQRQRPLLAMKIPCRDGAALVTTF